MFRLTSLLTLFLLWFCSSVAVANEPKIYTDPESFKSGLSVGVVKEKNIDINSDGRPDVLFYTTGGEEIYLDILIGGKDHFTHLKVPIAEDYEIIEIHGRYELKIGRGTFPSYGDIHGSDKYLWYDFYEVIGLSLELRNLKHPQVYERMLKLYRERIQELEHEIDSLERKKSGGQEDISTLEIFIRLRKDHIERYREFIRNASTIILSGKRT
jgi:hypothetical protein